MHTLVDVYSFCSRSWIMPRSVIFAFRWPSSKTFLVARSRWTTLREDTNAMPLDIWRPNMNRSAVLVSVCEVTRWLLAGSAKVTMAPTNLQSFKKVSNVPRLQCSMTIMGSPERNDETQDHIHGLVSCARVLSTTCWAALNENVACFASRLYNWSSQKKELKLDLNPSHRLWNPMNCIIGTLSQKSRVTTVRICALTMKTFDLIRLFAKKFTDLFVPYMRLFKNYWHSSWRFGHWTK